MRMTGTVATDQAQRPDDSTLQRSLKQRHMTMISLGGVIGAGLFVGSGAVMNEPGPAGVLSYVAAGARIVLVMRMLGGRQPRRGCCSRSSAAATRRRRCSRSTRAAYR